MKVKRAIIEVLGRDCLKSIVDDLELDGVDRRSVDSMRKAVSKSRRATPEYLSERLYERDAKEVCGRLGLSTKGRKNVLIQRLLGNGEDAESTGKQPAKPGATDGKIMSNQRGADSYQHLDSTSLARPDVGTQAQFKKKKPPVTYRYDSSLSPELDWDGQNSAREEGEQRIAEILAASERLEQVRQQLQGELSGDEASALRDELAELQQEIYAAADGLKRLGKPFLNWAGKAERMSFDVPTLPLFVHERLSTEAIIETLTGHRKKKESDRQMMLDFFADPQRPVTDQVLKAYEYQDDWVNRMILGDSLVVMNSLVHYENLGGQVQMIYMDPPYGVKFGSNFQPFVRRRDVKHNDDQHMTREPEMVQAYRDTWEVGLHSYLTYLRDRLLLSRELLHPSGSIFVQISDENVHHVRELMDEVFGAENFQSLVVVRKTTSESSSYLGATTDYLLWYARSRDRTKYRQLFTARSEVAESRYDQVLLADGEVRPATSEEKSGQQPLPDGARLYRFDNITSSRPASGGDLRAFDFEGQRFTPGRGTFKTDLAGMERLAESGRLQSSSRGKLNYRRFRNDFGFAHVGNLWNDISGAVQSRSDPKVYVVQTSTSVVERCMQMVTDPGDLVLDPTCGSGTTAYVAEQWGRRWLTIDTSRVPLALTRQRLLTATFSWYELKDESRGPGGGFVYKRKQNKKGEEVGGIVPHVTLKSIANNEPPKEEVLVDRPEQLKKITRVSGPFCFEATIPTPVDWNEDEQQTAPVGPAVDFASYEERMLEILRKSPVLRLDKNRTVTLHSVRPPAKSLSLSAEAMVEATAEGQKPTLEDAVQEAVEQNKSMLPLSRHPVAFVFGPENGAISERLVFEAAREAYAKSYTHLYVIGFAIQSKAREFIENANEVVGVPATYVQATPDLMMGDLLKNMRSSQIFSVCGLPEIKLHRKGGKKNPKYQVELLGLDVFDPATMDVDTRAGSDVPVWFLDSDYNDLCFHVCQAFFPRTAAWNNIKKSLKGTHDESVWDHLAGTKSAPFEAGEHRQIAVKVIDDRGNELLVVKNLDEVDK